jgi:hypothetical protein
MVNYQINPLAPGEDGKPREEIVRVPEEYTPRDGARPYPLNPPEPPVIVSDWERLIARVADVAAVALDEIAEALRDGRITVGEALNIAVRIGQAIGGKHGG